MNVKIWLWKFDDRIHNWQLIKGGFGARISDTPKTRDYNKRKQWMEQQIRLVLQSSGIIKKQIKSIHACIMESSLYRVAYGMLMAGAMYEEAYKIRISV